ncbi:MAG: dTDP-4-amino-4,6-dideoxygalactose transaminase [Planctomycetes bacterium]|nr:dTDP-4-amino-4,6-dideoxygalactose transaminase [Planctomycetota bacterium]
MTLRVPFNRPCFAGPELDYARQALAAGHLSGDGPFTKRCNALLEGLTGARKALLTTSCTHALEMCSALLGVGPGDEVVVPSFTFVSTVNAFVLNGATPVFCDVRDDTLNLDERILPSLLTPRTKAVVVVHYAGVGCEMDEILRICGERGIAVVEDNAHGLFARWRGRPLGSFGVLATQSFHETKNVQCGEGGALLVNDDRHAHRAEVIREKGTNRTAYFRGEVDKYTWVDVGSSWLPSDLLAAVLLAQLENAESIQAKRRAIWDRYLVALAPWARETGVRVPAIPAHCEHPSHMFHLRFHDAAERQSMIAHLRSRDVHAVFHYQPLHLSPMGVRHGGRPGQCPVTERAGDQLLRLPLWNDLPAGDQALVIDSVLAWRR